MTLRLRPQVSRLIIPHRVDHAHLDSADGGGKRPYDADEDGGRETCR